MPVHFLDDRIAIATEVQNLFRDAREIYCIVAFWGSGAEQLFNGMNRRKIQRTKIVCNLTMGGTNPNVIEDLQAMGFQIKHNPTLHSKVYWTDSGVVVGSANASVNGLSLEGRDQDGWLEAAIFSDRKSEINTIQQYVDEIWNQSSPISPQDMEKAHARWRRRHPFPTARNNLTFIEALMQGRFSGRSHQIYIQVDQQEIADWNDAMTQAEELHNQHIELQGLNLQPWEGYPEIPRNQYIVDYWYRPPDPFSFQGIWRTLPEHYDDPPAANGSMYQFAYNVNAGEIGMTRDQQNQMTQITQCVVANHLEWLEEQGCCIALEQLLDPPINDCLEQVMQNGQ